MDFVKVEGKSFYCGKKEILFSGLGIGSWLNIEHFMAGIPTTDSQIRRTFGSVFTEETGREFFTRFTECFVTDEDFIFLKKIGVNLLRVPFHYHLFIDDQNPEVLKEEGFRIFDRLMMFSRKYQIYILPDLHSVPGGQNPDWHSDNQTGYPQFWYFKVFRDQMADMWQAIAARYKEEPYLLGYDLLNEPFLIPKEDRISQFYDEVTQAIRQVDQNHIIFLEGDFFAMDFSCIHSITDEQTALTFHYYPTVWNTELIDKDYDRNRRKAEFEKVFLNLIKIREQFDRPILCGEAGYDIDKEDLPFTIGLIEDTLEIFRKYKVSWTLWSYKDAQLIGIVYPKSDSPWMKLVSEIGGYWNHYLDTDIAQRVMEDLCGKHFPGASEEDRYHLRFAARAIVYHLQEKYWLKAELEKLTGAEVLALPESFLFQNCCYYEEYVTTLQKYSYE
ncbi:glycoside hydrolase family 5 protein [Anaerocolumna jejuensis]|uniref:glycoside hydrolase family 5 protein n=1 Tax=Anaerocolumna jejuensis TaxID=259063 RepID=UPI003F7C894D